ncbi:hypothetical protein OUZ56_007446 [Daphnia magna]|uniref:Uncharacterized protein n=1 Tax=Daphnia magna TaxID=35525 RepID=A0ABR0AA66_9CRUS|nr:hypothetical protein OUZ56_007446 [Daphnia magna]
MNNRQSSESPHHGESSGKGRAAWHAVFNPDRPQNQVQHVRDVSVYPWSVDSRRIDGLGPVASLPCSGPMSAGTTDEVQSRATCQCFNLSLKGKD